MLSVCACPQPAPRCGTHPAGRAGTTSSPSGLGCPGSSPGITLAAPAPLLGTVPAAPDAGGAACLPGMCRTFPPARRPRRRDGHGAWLRLLVRPRLCRLRGAPAPSMQRAGGGGRSPLAPRLTVTSRCGTRSHACGRAVPAQQPGGMCCVSVLGSFLIRRKCELCPGKGAGSGARPAPGWAATRHRVPMCVCRNVCGFYIKSRCLLCTRVCCCARAAGGAGHLPGARGPRRLLQGEEPRPARTAVLGKPARGRLFLAGQGWTIGWCRRVAMVISSAKSLCAWPSVGLGHTGPRREVPASPCSDAAQGWCQRVPVTPLSGCRAAVAASSGSTRLFWGRAWRCVLQQAVWWEQSGVTPAVRGAAERWGDAVPAEAGRGDPEEEKRVPGSGAASSRRGAVAAPFPRTTMLCCTWDPAASPGDRQVLILLPQSCRQSPAALPAGPKSAMANDRDLRCGAAHDLSCLGSAGSESTGLGGSGELHTKLACRDRPSPRDGHCLAPGWTNAPNFLPSLFWDIKKATGGVGWCCASRHGPWGRRGTGRGKQIPSAPRGTELEGPAPPGARSRYVRNGRAGAPRQPSATPPRRGCSRGASRTPSGHRTSPGMWYRSPDIALPSGSGEEACRRGGSAAGGGAGGSLRSAGRAVARGWRRARAKPDG